MNRSHTRLGVHSPAGRRTGLMARAMHAQARRTASRGLWRVTKRRSCQITLDHSSVNPNTSRGHKKIVQVVRPGRRHGNEVGETMDADPAAGTASDVLCVPCSNSARAFGRTEVAQRVPMN